MFNSSFNSSSFNQTDEASNIIDLSADLSGSGTIYSRKITDAADNAFNNMSFNTAPEDSSTQYVLEFSLLMGLFADLSGQGNMEAQYTREYALEPERMSGEGRMSAVTLQRIIMASTSMSGEGRLFGEASRYHVDYIEFNGNFAPGNQIVMDSNTMTFTLNGQNAMHMMSGDFLQLQPGENILEYTDNQTGRNVRIRVTYRDKYAG